MAKCNCEESRSDDPRWRKKGKRLKGAGFEFNIVCLSCEYEWWSNANYVDSLRFINSEEANMLRYPMK